MSYRRRETKEKMSAARILSPCSALTFPGVPRPEGVAVPRAAPGLFPCGTIGAMERRGRQVYGVAWPAIQRQKQQRTGAPGV